jgi:hypothetical protein
MGRRDLLLGPHEQSIGGIGRTTQRRGGYPYAPYGPDALPPLQGRRKIAVPAVLITAHGKFFSTVKPFRDRGRRLIETTKLPGDAL